MNAFAVCTRLGAEQNIATKLFHTELQPTYPTSWEKPNMPLAGWWEMGAGYGEQRGTKLSERPHAQDGIVRSRFVSLWDWSLL